MPAYIQNSNFIWQDNSWANRKQEFSPKTEIPLPKTDFIPGFHLHHFLLLCLFPFTLAQCVTGHNAAGVTDSLNYHGRKLLCNNCYWICRYKSRSDSSHNHCYRWSTKSKQWIRNKYRNADRYIILNQGITFHPLRRFKAQSYRSWSFLAENSSIPST